ncbi:hypothetical protein GGF41_000174 [Coemansia sp. RSA 2531]|nr:hypothetical protein GGF41_000174 [Coemansia sp. RSA 2531]
MSLISLFQYLPYHVTQLIINYVVGRIRTDSDGVITGLDKRKARLKPLLGVCSNCRSIALPLYCLKFSIDFTSVRPGVLEERRPFAISPGNSSPVHHHLASVLTFATNEWDAYTGESLKRLSVVPYNDYAFPMARLVNLYFASNILDENSVPTAIAVENNITAFVRRIRQMVPKATKIRVVYTPHCSQARGTRFIGTLVSQLFQLSSHVMYFHNFGVDVPIRLQLDIIRNLVSLDFMIDSYTCPSIQLVRHNAPTLQTLLLASDCVADLASLIQSPDGSYVTYPHLRYLYLRDDSDDYTPERIAVKGVVPFPCLQRICLRSSYPFGDDVLFRGNSSTLERLELFMSDLLVSIIFDHNVFTPTSHPNLRRVVTKYQIEEYPSQLDTPADTLRFMLSICPGAPVREVVGDHSSSELVPALISTLNYASIRVLTLPFLRLELLDIVALVRALPALSTLRTLPPIFGSILNHVDMDDLPTYITATYAPNGRRLQYWNYQPVPPLYRAENATCMLLLALAYPDYTYIGMLGGEAKGFREELEAAVALNMFKPYAPRLQDFVRRSVEFF